jgi:hypothetical protein
VQLAEFIKTYEFGLSTILTADEVKEEPVTVVKGQDATTLTAFGFNLMPHFRCPFLYDRTSNRKVAY